VHSSAQWDGLECETILCTNFPNSGHCATLKCDITASSFCKEILVYFFLTLWPNFCEKTGNTSHIERFAIISENLLHEQLYKTNPVFF
jgi:hypothetical protein